jgi:hypothetical protein
VSSPLRLGRRWRRAIGLGALLLGQAGLAVADDYRESYSKGIEAVDRGEWPAVANFMRQAAAAKDKEGERVKIYGMRIEAYLPHYYLGLALEQTGNCEGALSQWQESESQGAVKSTGQYKSLVKERGVCKQQLASKAPAQQTQPADNSAVLQAQHAAETAVQKATEAAGQISHRKSEADYADAWKAESAQTAEANANQTLTSARGYLEHGKAQNQVSDLNEATRLANRARQDLDSLVGRLDQRKTEIHNQQLVAQQRNHQREDADREAKEKAQRGEADRLAREKDAQDVAAKDAAAKVAAAKDAAAKEAARREQVQRQTLTDEIARLSTDARTMLSRHRVPAGAPADPTIEPLKALLRKTPPPADTTVASLEQLRDQLSRQTTATEKALSAAAPEAGPPAEIRAAARALFRADYTEVVKTLGVARFTDHRAQVTAALLLGAARYSLYLEGGQKDEALKRQALEAARACRRLSPQLAPDAKFFSPRFLQFYRDAA